MRRLAFFLCCLGAIAARAGTNFQISLEPDAHAHITVGTPFDLLPHDGYAPITIKIDNAADRARTWQFDFKAPARSYRVDVMTSGASLTVPAKSARSFNLTVPLPVNGSQNNSASLSVRVSGPGQTAGSFFVFPQGNTGGLPVTPFIGMSDALALNCWSQLEAELKSAKKGLTGAKFQPEDLPEDWRALLGLAGLSLRQAEVDKFSPAQRAALHDWISRGGTLFLYGNSDAVPAEFADAGFGKVVAIASENVEVAAAARALDSLGSTSLAQIAEDSQPSAHAADRFGKIRVNLPLLIGFMVCFAILAGPINLFLFAGHGRRHRLFWTTPLISLVASALLFVVIVLQDGFGGAGSRFAIIALLPAEKKSVLLQEQIARTGLIWNSTFNTRDQVFLAPFNANTTQPTERNFENIGTRYGGDWFRSRSVQAHWIESITSTRAEIALLNATENRSLGAAPVVLSSIAAPLDQLYFQDESGRNWRGQNIRTGEKATLASVDNIPLLIPAETSARMETMWRKIKNQRGHFYASTHDPRDLIDTLASIHWSEQQVVYTGAISLAPTP